MSADTVGLLGFLLALVLGLLRMWEALFHRPRFKIDFRFNVDRPTRIVDSAFLSVMNVGRAKGGVLHIRFLEEGESSERGLSSMEVLFALPLVLDSSDVQRLRIPVAGYGGGFAEKLVKGELREVALVDLNDKVHRFPLPHPPRLPEGALKATLATIPP